MLFVPLMNGLAIFHSKLYALIVEDKIEPENLINAGSDLQDRRNLEKTELLDGFD